MNWTTPEQEHRDAWSEWLAERPENVRTVAERFDPWTMYRLTTTGQRCQVIGFHETSDEATPVTVYIYAEHETLGPMSGVQVFGIDPATLVPWDGSERAKWVVEEIPAPEHRDGGDYISAGVSYRIDEPEPEGGWKRLEVIGVEDGTITLGRKP